ncbi:hypothetical protein PsorP6_013872 [Peronosclerospora sorghi]|uniref:Uncharacterized protein n=1 Tax=Peronosclerospora sorghi TaxID=230839 RepID=A0ACC0VJE1_9STRA|nr:hypothetical protein PsorP6_013872 [Peronosclerospora sorghi]
MQSPPKESRRDDEVVAVICTHDTTNSDLDATLDRADHLVAPNAHVHVKWLYASPPRDMVDVCAGTLVPGSKRDT